VRAGSCIGVKSVVAHLLQASLVDKGNGCGGPSHWGIGPSVTQMRANNPHLEFATARAVTMAVGALDTSRDMAVPSKIDPHPLHGMPLLRDPLAVGNFGAAAAPSSTGALVPQSPASGGASTQPSPPTGPLSL
jgi:hypothetical protein